MLIKLIALGNIYFRDSWNIFDFIVILGSVLSIFVKFGLKVQNVEVIAVLRTFRIFRIFRLIKRAKGIRLIF